MEHLCLEGDGFKTDIWGESLGQISVPAKNRKAVFDQLKRDLKMLMSTDSTNYQVIMC